MLNRTAQGAVRELEKLGICDLTANEIVRLHVLGEIQERAGKRRDFVSLGIPVEVGNVVLYPMSCAGRDWFSKAIDWFSDAPANQWWVLPYALAHSRTNGAFVALDTASKASGALSAWIEGLTATPLEIDEACGMVWDIREDTERAEARSCFFSFVSWLEKKDAKLTAEIMESCKSIFLETKTATDESADETERDRWLIDCAELAALCGGNPRDWYNEETRLVTHAYKMAMEAMAARAGAFGDGHKQVPREMIEAIKNFRAAVAEIVGSRKERSVSNGG